jgi:preprotein translocase subunit SecE
MTERSTSWLGQSREYLAEVQGEFNKITWPPQSETVNGSISVVVIVVFVATFLGIVDFILSRLMQQVLG